ncbi:MAG TPA: hypothetical protein DHV15_10530 [Treponema sp.]|uniref:Uncharacterized protein n=1 Tax=Treponema denticola (strain ATCC 35405 / DSM 14222 / CIP 103919 / JCM 8153 / KCTC 15104) TaxID=243275 RepID=Q73LH8_TREDE|nr:hypothetical protein TDE_1885 [Treponema denticola ATCC 35405]HCY95921.1 hypothetical protein [Treponema sp.]
MRGETYEGVTGSGIEICAKHAEPTIIHKNKNAITFFIFTSAQIPYIFIKLPNNFIIKYINPQDMHFHPL